MPTYKILKPTGIPTPGSLSTLTGGKVAKASTLATALHNQDRILWHGRRLHTQTGLYGAQYFRIPDVDPDGTGSQEYPAWDHEVVVARSKVVLGPGYVLWAKVIALPSGPCQKYDGGTASWILDDVPAHGEIQITVDYGGVYSAVRTIKPPISGETYYAQPQGDGAAWEGIYEEVVDLKPALYQSISIAAGMFATWAQTLTAEVTVTYIGSPRVIDLVVWEEPGIAVTAVDGSIQIESVHFYTDGQGKKYPKYPSKYPIEYFSIDNEIGGSFAAMLKTKYEQYLLHPLLVQWSNWDETTGPTDTEPYISITGTSFADVHDSNFALTTYSESYGGWTVSSASYARKFSTSDEELVFRGKDGVLALKVAVWASHVGGAGQKGIVRVQTSISSWIDVEVTGSSADWHTAYGYLRVGTSAEDVSVLRLFARVTSGTLNLKSVCIYGAKITELP